MWSYSDKTILLCLPSYRYSSSSSSSTSVDCSADHARYNNVSVSLAVFLRGDALKTQVIWPTSAVLP